MTSTLVHHRTPPRAAVLSGLVALLLAVLAWPALGHAQVRETFPVDGQRLEVAPDEAWLEFNEGVQLPTAGLRVFDAAGERVDQADARVDPDDPNRILVGLDPALGDGTYIVTWRAVSADGHPIKGAWLYSVGEGGEVGQDLLATLFAGGGDAPLVAAAVVVRGVGFAALLLLAGLAVFRRHALGSHGTEEEGTRLVDLGAGAAIAVVVTSLLGIPLQAMLETGLGLGALAPAPLLDVLTQPVGAAAALRASLAGLALALLRRGDGRTWSTPAALASLATAATVALDGHQLTQDPVAVIMVGDLVHVLAAAVWTGGLVGLWLVVRDRRRADDPVGAATVTAGFSRMAAWSLLAVVVAGSTMSWVTVRAARAVTTTDYGRTLLLKLFLVAILILVGLYNNRRLVPAVTAALPGADPDEASAEAADLTRRVADGAWVRLRQTLRIEVALVLAITLVTGLLVGQQPASQEAGVTGAFSTYVDLTDELEINLVVDPNRAGLNEVHIYLLDSTGRTVDSDEVEFVLELPARDIGPLSRVPRDAGPGHWSLTGRELAVAGEWEITVVVRISTFEEARATIGFVVNP